MTDAPTEREGEGVFSKLRRRKVVQWGLAYTAGAWTFLQVIEYLGETYAWPPAIRQIVTPAPSVPPDDFWRILKIKTLTLIQNTQAGKTKTIHRLRFKLTNMAITIA